MSFVNAVFQNKPNVPNAEWVEFDNGTVVWRETTNCTKQQLEE